MNYVVGLIVAERPDGEGRNVVKIGCNLVERIEQELVRVTRRIDTTEGVAQAAPGLVDLEQLIPLLCGGHPTARRQIHDRDAAEKTTEPQCDLSRLRIRRVEPALHRESMCESKVDLQPTELIRKHLDERGPITNATFSDQVERQPRIGNEAHPAFDFPVDEVVIRPALLIPMDHLTCEAKGVVLQFHVVHHFNVPPLFSFVS